MLVRGVFAGMLAVGAAALITPAAHGATALGQTGVLSPFACGTAYTFVQNTSSGPPYAAPTDGVITSWSHVADGNPGQKITFKLFRTDPALANHFFSVGADQQRNITPS